MKICFVGPANSSHIEKWCKWFAGRDHEVHVISFTEGTINDAIIHVINLGVDPDGSDFYKLKYIFSGNKIRKEIESIAPDIINVHYATSYGIAVAMSGIKDYILSVWGSDIYGFPNKSIFHKTLLKYSLKKATYLFSTSRAMADEASKYTNKEFLITPFGVDMDLFSPIKRNTIDEKKDFIVGTVKSLKPEYGIEYILKAVALVKKTDCNIPIKVRIAGTGYCFEDYKKLAKEFKIDVEWLGFISQAEAAVEWANMDCAVIPSMFESFGVAAVEAESSGIPVIISNISGLMEATKPGETSIVVPRADEKAIADSIMKLYYDPDLRKNMGMKARQYVEENYEINQCFEIIESFYIDILKKKGLLV